LASHEGSPLTVATIACRKPEVCDPFSLSQKGRTLRKVFLAARAGMTGLRHSRRTDAADGLAACARPSVWDK